MMTAARFPTKSAAYPFGASMTLADEILSGPGSGVDATLQPANEAVAAGDTATFTASASGSLHQACNGK